MQKVSVSIQIGAACTSCAYDEHVQFFKFAVTPHTAGLVLLQTCTLQDVY